jgi:methylated-DNA-[protein]-cysteine S-methyltransferase
MFETLKYTIIHITWGWIAVLYSSKGLVATSLPQRTEQHALMALGRNIEQAVSVAGGLEDLLKRLRDYYDGRQVAFTDRLDLEKATRFQRRVWEVTRSIPYGETRSYLWIARRVRSPRGARAVGQALGANPLPIIIPCHRVVSSDGGLGGFSGGLNVKRRLLKLEGTVSIR